MSHRRRGSAALRHCFGVLVGGLHLSVLELARKYKYRAIEADAFRLLAEIYRSGAAPDQEEAERHYLQASEICLQLGLRPELARCEIGLGQTLMQSGRQAEAERLSIRLRSSVAAWAWSCRMFASTARPLSIHPEPDRQTLGPADEDRRRATWPSGYFDRCEPAEQLLEEDSHLEPRQMLAEAGVGSLTEQRAA